MKISIKSAIIVSFTALISLVLIVQLIFNTFFATNYYVSYKCGVMENAYEEMVDAFDGTEESIADIAYKYENQHSIDITISMDKELFYSSHERFIDMHYMQQGIRTNQLFDMPETEFVKNPKAMIMKENTNAAISGSSVNLAGLFVYEEAEITIMMTLPMASIESSVAVFSRSSLLISIIAILIGLIVAIYLSKKISKPLKEMEQVSSDIARLDFTEKMKEDTMFLEFHHVSKSVNSMSKQLEDAIFKLNQANAKLQLDIDKQTQLEELRREFVANVSHEMKTPLALLQLYAENLRCNIDGIDKDYYCDTIIEESVKMSEMVTSMLNISAVESGLSQMEFRSFSVSNMVKECMQKLAPMLENHSISYNIDEDIFTYGDQEYLEQAVKNYINNAIEHTNQGGNIKIMLNKMYDRVIFSVYNDGDGIEEAEMERLWDSFYRSDKARVRTRNNVGLGLHIVKTIIDKHDGQCSCKNVEGGALFSFSIPVCESFVSFEEEV
ncbi:MAG: HAMP domain-containing sensor histidine kinase [Lachnospiraceae bacterium]